MLIAVPPNPSPSPRAPCTHQYPAWPTCLSSSSHPASPSGPQLCQTCSQRQQHQEQQQEAQQRHQRQTFRRLRCQPAGDHCYACAARNSIHLDAGRVPSLLGPRRAQSLPLEAPAHPPLIERPHVQGPVAMVAIGVLPARPCSGEDDQQGNHPCNFRTSNTCQCI